MNIEYSLAASYLFIGTAIGLIIWYAFANILGQNESNKYADKVLKMAIILAILGVVFATLHLGRMGRFMNLILNPTSWLSREAFFAGAFTGGIILYYFLIRNKLGQFKKYNLLLYAVVAAGFCTFICMGMIYATVTAIPAWNTSLLVLVNIASGLLLGGILFLLIAKNDLADDLFKTLAISLLSVALVSIIINIAYDAHINMAFTTLKMQGVILPSIWLGSLIKVGVGLLIPIYLIAKFINKQSNNFTSFINIAFVCILIGEVTNKIMHFIVAIKTPFL